FGNGIGHVHSVRVVRQTCDFGVELGIEKALVQIHRHDVTAVVRQRFGGKRLALPEPQARFRQKGRGGYVLLPFNSEIFYESLRAFGKSKSDVKVGFAVDKVAIDLHLLVPCVFVERGNFRHTSTKQLFTEHPPRERERTTRFDNNLSLQLVFAEMLVTQEIDVRQSVATSTNDVVD